MKRTRLAAAVGLMLVALIAGGAFAKGPSNAGGKHEDWSYWPNEHPNWASYLYIGPDYGAGSTSTETEDGSVIDPIPGATLAAKGRFFSDEDFTDKDWVMYKFWLTEPVDITLPSGEVVTATEFIFIRQRFGEGHPVEIVNYK